MIRTTYEFYTMEYHGSVIPDDTSFKSKVIEATSFVDSVISCKSLLNSADNEFKYNCAVCSVADELYKHSTVDETKQKQSESVGNHSVTYSNQTKTFKERQAIMHSKVRIYLAGTGLLYRGLR